MPTPLFTKCPARPGARVAGGPKTGFGAVAALLPVLVAAGLLAGCGEQVTSPPLEDSHRGAVGATGVSAVSDGVRQGTTKATGGIHAMLGAGSVQDLTDGLTADAVAQALVGPGVTISNVAYTGVDRALGTFTGGLASVGIEEGIMLSSGWVKDAEGPNTSSSTSRENGTPGDPDLDALSGFTTFDAAVLEFDFHVPLGTDRVFVEYVFGSEEYNEYVGTVYNDVFAFFVNGVNCAEVAGAAVTINSINNGANPNINNQVIGPTNPAFYVNNDPIYPDITGNTVPSGDLRNTEMDGMTVVLVCEAPLDPTETDHTMKIAIADATDAVWDSWVLLREGSFSIVPPFGDEGCSLGYWKNHPGSWMFYDPEQSVGSVFDDADPYDAHTLMEALSLRGGPGVNGAKQILLRQAVAALLNAAHPDVAYTRSPAGVISAVNAALASGHRQTMLALAEELDADNNLGCPLN